MTHFVHTFLEVYTWCTLFVEPKTLCAKKTLKLNLKDIILPKFYYCDFLRLFVSPLGSL